MPELNLDGGEITLLKQIGLSGAQMYGRRLVSHMEEDEIIPFLRTLNGLIEQGYVITNKATVRTIEEVERAFFRINPAFAVALRDAVSPARRMNREREQERTRRRRRR